MSHNCHRCAFCSRVSAWTSPKDGLDLPRPRQRSVGGSHTSNGGHGDYRFGNRSLPQTLSAQIDCGRMSAFGPKQTLASALHMSAFRGKADMPFCGCLLSRSLLGVKRTCAVALRMSAFDPKRTLGMP